MSPRFDPSRGCVLVVDDEASVRYVILRVLEDLGVRAVEASTAAEARAAAQVERFACALIDKNLIGESGLELLRWLRAEQPACLAVVMTAYGNLESSIEALRLGAWDYLLKPFDLDGLTHRIGRALEQHQLAEDHERLQGSVRQSDRLISLGTLAAGIVHELNNPLTYVLANLEYLHRELPRATAEVQEAQRAGDALGARLQRLTQVLTETRDGAERMRQLVRDVRTFARPDEDAQRSVDVRAALEATLKMASLHLRQRAQLERDYEDVPPVRGSEAKLGQLLLNLLVNAAQAIPPGNPLEHKVRVRLARAPGERVVIEVQDTGCGIAPEHLPRLFQPFFTTKPAGQGTGLGLSICKSIVDELGGSLQVSSSVGQGTTFRVELPGLSAAAPQKRESVVVMDRSTRRGRVLVADDDEAVGTALARLLEREHDVEAVTRGQQVLAAVEAGERYDAIVLDLQMPDLTGMDVFARLQQVAPEQAERVLFVTADTFSQGVQAFTERHADRVLEKPHHAQSLKRLLRAVVG
ncbi:response regulator [Aggregicoccus sp. 17bor-14]|uniref:response regulator n=1 Tax=Myxococcaceae TaxID=31 RepID=UPI00129C1EBC|nr:MULTISPECIES: response regulator [Myxococcaceae]MBF5042034.1 response regulator [Simulacricoccus sp. 17bor-14]MRI87813.1 response regulator [Aggregicoccus sp. 17bor-14]